MAMQIVYHIRASVAYYQLKVAVHNFTVYNMALRDAKSQSSMCPQHLHLESSIICELLDKSSKPII